MDRNLRSYLAELIGTFAVVFIAAAAVCGNWLRPDPGSGWSVVGIALAYGLAYAVGLALTVPSEGGYLNPAVTLMLWVFNRLDALKTTCLIGCQALGAVLAGGAIRLIFPQLVLFKARVGTPHLNLQAFGMGSVTPAVQFKGAGMELALTLILTLVLFAVFIDPRAPRWQGTWGRRLTALWAGLAVVALTLAGYWLTGAAMNPARWFGTVVWESSADVATPYADHLVYWFGPIAGALLAGLAYIKLFLPEEEAQHPAATPAKVTAGAGATLFRAKK